MLTTQLMVGFPRMTGIWAVKLALNSIYLNSDHDIAQWSCVGITQPHTSDFGTYEVGNWPYLQ